MSIANISVKTIDRQDQTLADYLGKVVLIVPNDTALMMAIETELAQ